jgi:hypothetical protein
MLHNYAQLHHAIMVREDLRMQDYYNSVYDLKLKSSS